MKSIVYSQTGDPSVLQLVDRPMTEPGAGEVRVRIVVSGVNPTDWTSRRGSATAALARAAGAQHVLTYTDPDVVARIRAIAVYANNGGDQVTLDVRQHVSLTVRDQFVLLYTVGAAVFRAAAASPVRRIHSGRQVTLALGERTV